MRPVVVLGATGSIGRQTLDVLDRLGVEPAGLAARRPSPEFAELLGRYPSALGAVAEAGPDEAAAFAGTVSQSVDFGRAAVEEMAGWPGHVVVNGIVGAAGLASTLAGLRAANRVALANKESLVVAGPLVTAARSEFGGELIPVDSEHSALFQCLEGEHPDDVARLVLTASGGPFRGKRRSDLTDVVPSEALAHPTWEMGGRITVDSATLANKGFEVIEAHHLFGVDFDQIAVVVHPQSIVHSAVEFVDGSLKAHVGQPDMRIPIQFALTYPRRHPGPGAAFDLAAARVEFEPVDRDTFPILDLAYAAGRAGGTSPAVLNAADEVAVAAFLAGDLPFLAIADVLAGALDQVEWREIETVDDVAAADAEARQVASRLVKGLPITAPQR